MEPTGHVNFRLFAASRKRKFEVCFRWSANDQRFSTVAISIKVPIYVYC